MVGFAFFKFSVRGPLSTKHPRKSNPPTTPLFAHWRGESHAKPLCALVWTQTPHPWQHSKCRPKLTKSNEGRLAAVRIIKQHPTPPSSVNWWKPCLVQPKWRSDNHFQIAILTEIKGGNSQINGDFNWCVGLGPLRPHHTSALYTEGCQRLSTGAVQVSALSNSSPFEFPSLGWGCIQPHLSTECSGVKDVRTVKREAEMDI